MVGPTNLRAFATKNFMRFARNFGATEQDLWDAIQKTPDTDLGGSVFKFRLARKGEAPAAGPEQSSR